MPMTSPSPSYVAPPESPEITSALISIRPVSLSAAWLPSLWVVMSLSVPVTVPSAAEKVEVDPPASPTAVTAAPTAIPSVSGVTVARPAASCSWRTATSSLASVPMTSASYVVPVLITFTVILVAPSTTWWLVTTSPLLVRIIPVPAALPPEYFSVAATRTRPVSWSLDAGSPPEEESNGDPSGPSPPFGPENGEPPNGAWPKPSPPWLPGAEKPGPLPPASFAAWSVRPSANPRPPAAATTARATPAAISPRCRLGRGGGGGAPYPKVGGSGCGNHPAGGGGNGAPCRLGLACQRAASSSAPGTGGCAAGPAFCSGCSGRS